MEGVANTKSDSKSNLDLSVPTSSASAGHGDVLLGLHGECVSAAARPSASAWCCAAQCVVFGRCYSLHPPVDVEPLHASLRMLTYI